MQGMLPKKERHEELRDAISRTIIIAHKEDTRQLENALSQEGLPAQVSRLAYNETETRLPSQIRCLLNHATAWKAAAERNGLTLIVEADFVPCRGIGSFPLPFTPQDARKQAAWIYSIGPVVYHYDEAGGFFGHNAGTVAYILDHKAAQAWLELFREHEEQGRLRNYYQFEVIMPIELRWKKGVNCYISRKNYGEHGGLENREHQGQGHRGWHQADTLMGPLWYLPAYAKGSRVVYVVIRARSRARYLLKFLMGKYFDGWGAFIKSRKHRMKRLLFSLGRVI